MAFNQEKIQELYPEAKMYSAMKINKGTDELLKKVCESGTAFGQIKKDGYWYQFEKHEHYSYLFSRSASTVTKLQSEKSANVPHIMKALSVLPKDTILIGEIYYPGGSSKTVTTIMGCLPKKAIERQNGKSGLIHYYIHDIIMFNGLDFVKNKVSNYDRYRILQKIFEKYNLANDYIELAEAWTDDLYSRVGTALAAGEEGMVIKVKDGIYEPDKRPLTMLKAKKVDFADVIITGFEEPTKEYYGKESDSWPYCIVYKQNDLGDWIEYKRSDKGYLAYKSPEYKSILVTKPHFMGWKNSRIKIGVYDKDGKIKEIGTIHSGISDEMKQDMTEHPEKYLNQVCEVQCMSLDKKEYTVRHGFLLRIRDDKNPEDCTIEGVFGRG